MRHKEITTIFKNILFQKFRTDRAKRLGKEFTWITIGQAATVLGALVGIRLLTELLSPSEYGQLALGMTVATLVQTVVLGPLSNGVMRFYAPAREAGSVSGYLGAVTRMTIGSTGGILLIALIVGLGVAVFGSTQWLGFGIAALIFALLSGYNGILNGIQNAARQRAIVAMHQGIATWGRFLIAAGLMFWLGASSTLAMCGYAIAMVFVLVSQYLFFRRVIYSRASNNNESKPASHWQSHIFKHSWPFATWGLLSWGRSVADRWGLEVFTTTDEVGLYAVLYQLGYYPIAMLVRMVTTLLAPIYFERVGDATSKERLDKIFRLGWKVAWMSTILLMAAVGITYYYHDLIFSLFVAKEYSHISYLLAPMMLSAVIYEATRFLTIVLHAQNATRILIIPTNVSHLLSFILILLGAYWAGLNGVVLAYIAQSLIAIFWVTAIFKRQHRLVLINE